MEDANAPVSICVAGAGFGLAPVPQGLPPFSFALGVLQSLAPASTMVSFAISLTHPSGINIR